MSARLNPAFSITELLVVVAIVTILAAVATPSYQRYVAKSKATQTVTLMKKITKEMQAYYEETNSWPANLAAIDMVSGDLTIANISTGGQIFPSGFHGGADPFVEVFIAATVFNVATLTAPRLALLGTVTNNTVQWTCYTHRTSSTANSIPREYLPTSCTAYP